jgi:hypothetical protein
MTTIVNSPNPAPAERTVVKEDASGWAIAVIILIAVIAIGAYLWLNRQPAQPVQTAQPESQDSTNINVTIPTPTDTNMQQPQTPDSGNQ